MKPELAPQKIERMWRAMAALDAIMNDKQWLGVYTFEYGEQMRFASIDNGAGDTLYGVFSKVGTLLKGFDHECEVSPWSRDDMSFWPGLFDGVPESLAQHLKDPALDLESSTFCLWWTPEHQEWEQGPVEFLNGEDDGSKFLLGYLNPDPVSHLDWAKDYYGSDFRLEDIESLYDLQFSSTLISRINPEADPEAVSQKLLELRLNEDAD